ncbi:MAG: 23S rRNA (adenine(2503)-C(2))-methyltransferase RlmN [Clostridia bacterium]|nr:23S rRNA (adenine(2503)-C(2))-methyltransferase RlmN [Clostridia bacterium]
MIILSDLDNKIFEEELLALNLKSFQIKAVKKWLLNGYKFDEMSDIPKNAREVLKEKYIDIPVSILEHYISKDGTVKFLYKTYTEDLVEGVVMKYEYGNTICVSSQVGCRMGCKFCASGIDGLKRNLSPSEILACVSLANRFLGGGKGDRKITNVVLMGSGEPLDNFDNVLEFIKMLKSEQSLNISERNVSLSTCGLVPKIRELADKSSGITLTISLHNPFNEERRQIMPITNAYRIEEVIGAAKYYFEKTGRRVVFEYTLIKGENDDDRHARELVRITRGFPTHINCIIYNEIKGKDFKAITRKDGYAFVSKLEKLGASATLRRQMGVDIEGACGMLKRRYLQCE